MDRRSFIKYIIYFFLFNSKESISRQYLGKEHLGMGVRRCESISDLKNIIPSMENEVVELISYKKGTMLGGGIFKSKLRTRLLSDDGGKYIGGNQKYIWVRVSTKGIIKPEWYGCIGDGRIDDSVAFNRMISALRDGDIISLRKNAEYFNALPDTSSPWIIKNRKITIIGNDAILSRRPTREGNKDIENLATLKVVGNEFTIKGKLKITGNEIKKTLVDKTDTAISRGVYSRGYVSSHGLYLSGVNGGYLSEGLVCCDAVFPCYIVGSSNLTIKGEYNCSGQVYPVTGNDLQLGSGIKIAKCTNFDIDISGSDCGYCLCEIEPFNKNGNVRVSSVRPYMNGCLIHQGNQNIVVDVNTVGAIMGAALRISSGSRKIEGIVHAVDCHYGCQIISEKNRVCEDIKLKLYIENVKSQDVRIFNTQKGQISLLRGDITVYNNLELDSPKDIHKDGRLSNNISALVYGDNMKNVNINLPGGKWRKQHVNVINSIDSSVNMN